MTDRWTRRWLDLATFFATWSKDPSTKVGCVLVGDNKVLLSQGYNGLPRGVADLPLRMERPAKYLWTSHAEESAVAHAARIGVSLAGCTAYVTHCPCSRCARSLIQAGVAKVITGPGQTNMEPEEFAVAATMFREAGVVVERCE